MTWIEILIFSPIVLLAYTTEAMTGFGAALVAVTLGAGFFDVYQIIPIILPLNILVTGSVAFRHRADIEHRLLVRRVLPFMGGGFVLGLVLLPRFQDLSLEWLLGLVVTGFSGAGLWGALRQRQDAGTPGRAWAGFFQFLAGLVQAVYTTGGPFLTYSLSRQTLPKGVFRATLCTVWATSNSLLCLFYLASGRINATSLKVSLLLLPLLPLGILLGERLHDRIDEETFRRCIYAILFLSGISLVFK